MYKALYRRSRPNRFSEIVGQEHISLTLKNEVINGTFSHAYIFTGSRGIGKTTTAKILAKALNCAALQNGEPCCECSICKGIDAGNIPDVQEIDAASNTGVDNIRAIKEDAQFAPTVGKYRVYIIDEAHMLSMGAFNALLKIMEEPPNNVVFILATTQINKIPATILSRCQRFDFLRPSVLTIEQLLLKVASKEDIAINSDALRLIAILSDGGMRDALSLLDVCSNVSNGKVIDESLVESIAAIPLDKECLNLLEATISSDYELCIKIVNECYIKAVDIISLCESLLRHCRNILLLKTCKKDLNLLEISQKSLKKTQEIAFKISLNQIMLILEEIKLAYEKLNKSSMPKIELELCLLNLCEKLHVLPTNENECNSNQASEDESFRIKNWQQVIECLTETNSILAGALNDSSAYIKNDTVLISSNNSIFLELIRNDENAKKDLKAAMVKILGKRYRIGPYKK